MQPPSRDPLSLKDGPQIALLVGLETEYISPLDLDHLSTLLERYRGQIDYIVGSIHHVNEVPIDFDLPTFQRAVLSCQPQPPLSSDDDSSPSDDLNPFINAYLDAQYTLMTRFHPQVIGHFDLFRLWDPSITLRPSTPDQPLNTIWSKIERNVSYAISYDAAFEINTAALRKGWSTPYPGSDILRVTSSYFSRYSSH